MKIYHKDTHVKTIPIKFEDLANLSQRFKDSLRKRLSKRERFDLEVDLFKYKMSDRGVRELIKDLPVNKCEEVSFNRMGYHSDGFLTDDINYVWCDKNPTVFNFSHFKLTLDDKMSMQEMEDQANEEAIEIYPENSLLRLDQFNIHKVSETKGLTLRTFIKVSFSDDKYDLKGNSKNHLLDYDWKMRDRELQRNIPQGLVAKK